MRIRSLKPEFWDDDSTTGVWPLDEKVVYAGLWSVADDAGRMEWSPRRIRAALFPYPEGALLTRGGPSVNFDAVLERLIESGCVVLYEVDGKSYAVLPKFGKHQKPNKPTPSRLPAPPAPLPHHSRSPTAPLPVGEERSGEERIGAEAPSGNTPPPVAPPCRWPLLAPFINAYQARFRELRVVEARTTAPQDEPRMSRLHAAIEALNPEVAGAITAEEVDARMTARTLDRPPSSFAYFLAWLEEQAAAAKREPPPPRSEKQVSPGCFIED